MPDNSTELFGRQQVMTVRPITADMCTITWYGESSADLAGLTPNSPNIVSGAVNITISYQQQVTRRRTLATAGGRPVAVIYPTQPVGSIQIQRLFADFTVQTNGASSGLSTSGTHAIFGYPGWNVCNGTAGLDITFDRKSAYKDCVGANPPGFRISGAIVTGFNISAEAEGLTVIDNISIEFLQMFQKA